jgi:hypothetical protein
LQGNIAALFGDNDLVGVTAQVIREFFTHRARSWEQVQMSTTASTTMFNLYELSREVQAMRQDIVDRLERLERQQADRTARHEHTEPTDAEVELEQDLFSGLRECVRSSWALLSSASSATTEDRPSTPAESVQGDAVVLNIQEAGLEPDAHDLHVESSDAATGAGAGAALIQLKPNSSQEANVWQEPIQSISALAGLDHGRIAQARLAAASSRDNAESTPFMVRRKTIGSPQRPSPRSSPRVPQANFHTKDDGKSPTLAVDPDPARRCPQNPTPYGFTLQFEADDDHFGDEPSIMNTSAQVSPFPEALEEQSSPASVTLSPKSVTTAFEVSRPGSSQQATPTQSAASSPRPGFLSMARRRNLLCLGDAACGKTALLQRAKYIFESMPTHHSSRGYEAGSFMPVGSGHGVVPL